MKALHIIESETPGLTRTKIIVTKERPVKSKTGRTMFTVADLTEMEKQKKSKIYKGKKIQKIYRSPWMSNAYFIRYFM